MASPSSRRAWIEIRISPPSHSRRRSPSSRRAWIEIPHRSQVRRPRRVALLAEGVDRNDMTPRRVQQLTKVALLAEGVDRNAFALSTAFAVARRPPRGGRG